jgi:hypothetical protein
MFHMTDVDGAAEQEHSKTRILYRLACLVLIEHMESVKFVHVAVRAGEDFILAVTYFD